MAAGFLTTSGAKGAAVLSAVAHVALVVGAAAVAHGRAAPRLVDAAQAEVVVVEAPTPEDDPPPPPDPPHDDDHPHAAPSLAHTHDYPVSPDHDHTPHDPRIDHRLAASHDDAPAAPAVIAAAGDAPVAVSMRVGNDDPAPGATRAVADAPHAAGPLPESAVSTRASAIARVKPAYPEGALAAHVQGDVQLEIVVNEAGAVTSARVTGPAGHGLDEAALAAIARFRFAPARVDGHAVAVRMAWVVQFRINK